MFEITGALVGEVLVLEVTSDDKEDRYCIGTQNTVSS